MYQVLPWMQLLQHPGLTCKHREAAQRIPNQDEDHEEQGVPLSQALDGPDGWPRYAVEKDLGV